MKICTWNVYGLSKTSEKLKRDSTIESISLIGANVFGLQEIKGKDIEWIKNEIYSYNPNLCYTSICCENETKSNRDIVLLYDKKFCFEKEEILEVGGERRTLYVKLRQKNSRKKWHFYISHFYDGRKCKRHRDVESFNILKHMEYCVMKKRKIFSNQKNNRIVFMGDFNLYGCKENAYKNIIGYLHDVGILANAECKEWVENSEKYKSLYTHSTHREVCADLRNDRFDFIFTWPKLKMNGSYQVFCDVIRTKDNENAEKYPCGKAPSDHLPVVWNIEKRKFNFFKLKKR